MSGQQRPVQELEAPTPCKVEQDPFDSTDTNTQPSQFFHPPMVIPPQMSSLNIFPPMAFPPSQLAEYEQQTNQQSAFPHDSSYHQPTDSGLAFGSSFHPPMILPPQYYSTDMPLSEHYPSDVSLQPSGQPAESGFSYHQSVDFHPTDPHMMLSPHVHPPMVLPSPQGQPNVDPIGNERKPSIADHVGSETSGQAANYSDNTSMPAGHGHGHGQQVGHGYEDYSAGHGIFYNPFSNMNFLTATTAPETSTLSWGMEVTTTAGGDGAGMTAWNEFGGGNGGGAGGGRSDDHRNYH